MKKIIVFYIIPALFLYSCIKPEVIPAPTPKVDLSAFFKGTINGTDVKWIQNVDDYECIPTKTKVTTQEKGKPSRASYFAEMKSESIKGSIRIGIGSVLWDYTLTDEPTKKLFNEFMLNNLTGKYSKDAAYGFEVQYTDKLGRTWYSDSLSKSGKIESFEFTGIKQESDIDFDYNKFIVTFNCYVYRTYTENNVTLKDSLPIDGAQFKGWFVR